MQNPHYIIALAERIRSCLPAETVLPEESSDLIYMYAVLALAKGISVTAEDVHNAWAAWALSHGRTGPSLVPFSELSPAERAKDEPFVRAIKQAIQKP